MGFFELIKTDTSSRARLGRMQTTRGSIDTPVFMPVGTQASVKAIDPRELNEMGTQIILGIATVTTGIDLPVAVLHQSVGALVLASTVWGAHVIGSGPSGGRADPRAVGEQR